MISYDFAKLFWAKNIWVLDALELWKIGLNINIIRMKERECIVVPAFINYNYYRGREMSRPVFKFFLTLIAGYFLILPANPQAFCFGTELKCIWIGGQISG